MSMLAHEEKLISFKRCRWCAAEIKDVMVCSTCGKEIWDNEFFNSFCRSQDRFFWICSLLALVVSVLPVGVLVGYPLLVCADRTYFKYLKFEGRLVASLLLNFLKTLLFLILLLCSTIPGVGTIVLIPFFIKALYSRHKFRRMISSELASGTQPAQVIPEIVS